MTPTDRARARELAQKIANDDGRTQYEGREVNGSELLALALLDAERRAEDLDAILAWMRAVKRAELVWQGGAWTATRIRAAEGGPFLDGIGLGCAEHPAPKAEARAALRKP